MRLSGVSAVKAEESCFELENRGVHLTLVDANLCGYILSNKIKSLVSHFV